MIKIDTKTFPATENNYYKIKTTKSQIVIAKSLRKDNFHIVRLLHKELGNSKEWNTFTVSREGIIYQHYDPKYYSDFLDIKEADKRSISIVLENMGCLFKTKTNEYVNCLNEKCNNDNVVEKKWSDYDYFEGFNNEQIKSLVELCKELCKTQKIPNECISFPYYNNDISKFKGIVFKSNYFENSGDVNPLFDISKFINKLNET